jgi:Domain of unknown function (DUF5916)/Carbohydrate family 9 binding domain-like
MLKRALFLVTSLAVCTVAEAANWPERPTLRAVRATAGPVIDGDLSDPVWQTAPEFTDFTQHDPDDGQPATLPTSVRILYDDHAIYFGAKMADPHPPTAFLVRRDTFVQGDFLSINIDPQLDRLSGNAFTVTPADVQLDSLLYNDIAEDLSWDGVWESSAKVVADGWVAEVRVPYSQLRFPDKPVHTWGLNITRRTARNNEWVRIVNTRKGETGFVSHFADVVGLEGIRRGKPLELVPYAVTRSDFRTRSNNPLAENQDYRADGGLDLKYALTPSLTLTGTINPDFGQVEVDPAVVNLTDFETFYPEKRPFFTEGLNMFRFGDTPAPSHFNFFQPPNLFYTRRIGRAPQRSLDADHVLAPAETTILGAAKLTGRTPGGWSVGVLEALTSAEHGMFQENLGDPVRREHFEPLTNYFVSRVNKTIGDGSRIGGMFTSVNRSLSDELQGLRKSAVTAGIDGYTSFANKSWYVEGFAVGSRMSGSEAALLRTQRSSARYYQRPDAGHVELDPSRTSLTGWGGRAMISKATGIWRPNVQVQAYSPGFETNDTGFMQRTDIISSHALMQFVDQRPTARLREKNGWFGVWQNQNFDGDVIERGAFVDAFATSSKYWYYRGSLFVSPGAFSDRLTRGGPLVRTGRSWSSDTTLESDNRKKFYFGLYGHLEGGEEDSYVRTVTLGLNLRPSSNLLLSLEPSYSRSHDAHAYVTDFGDTTAAATFGRRYVFAELEQRSFELGTRADWTLTPRLSFQLYLQPFIAAGDYHRYHSLAAARTRDYLPHAETASNPDFNFRSVRGSAVARWEFRPGSALYVVWNENRAQEIVQGDFSLNRDLRAISTAPSHDVFLVKVSYWLPM